MKHLKHLSLIAVLLTVVMTPWAESQAQTATKPAAVITLSSVDELVGDAKHVIAAIGLPGIDDQLNAMLDPVAGILRWSQLCLNQCHHLTEVLHRNKSLQSEAQFTF